MYYSNEPKAFLSEEEVTRLYDKITALSEFEKDTYIATAINKQIISMFQNLLYDYVDPNVVKRRLPSENGEHVPKKVNTMHYTVSIKPSTFPTAGDGVFLSAIAPVVPGTVLVLFPGLVHHKTDLNDAEYIKALLPDPNYQLLPRLDGSMIDGRKYAEVPFNPYALGHKINHCNTRKPNVLQVRNQYEPYS